MDSTQLGGFDRSARSWVLAIFALGGACVGLVVPYVADWATRLEWMPFQGPLRLLASFDQTWLVWGRPLIGALLGLIAGLVVVRTSAVLVIDNDKVQVTQGDEVTVIPREKVDGVRRSKDRITIVNAKGRELFSGDVEGGKDAAREAFTRHGYPWESG